MKVFFCILFFTLLSSCSSEDNDTALEITFESPGKSIVEKNCFVCHAQGINGAPIIGNKKMWSKRTSKGVDALVANAISGYGLMPAKGGKTHLTDDEIRLAVTYMLNQLN